MRLPKGLLQSFAEKTGYSKPNPVFVFATLRRIFVFMYGGAT